MAYGQNAPSCDSLSILPDLPAVAFYYASTYQLQNERFFNQKSQIPTTNQFVVGKIAELSKVLSAKYLPYWDYNDVIHNKMGSNCHSVTIDAHYRVSLH